MTPAEQTELTYIHGLITKGDHVGAVSAMMGDRRFSAFLSANKDKAPKTFRSLEDLQAVQFLFLMSLLYRRDYPAAAALIWGPDVFTSEPRSVRLIWNAIGKYNRINIIGAASMGKTYSAAARLVLEWTLDPEWTLVRVMSMKEDHCIKNLFGDMHRLYAGSAIPLPGNPEARSIATKQGKLNGQGIFPIVIPRGPDADGTIKGSKVKPRPKHPLFGTSSRTFLLIDEAQEVPENVFDQLGNLLSSIEDGDTEHTAIIMAANGKDPESRYGQNCIKRAEWDLISQRESPIDEWESDRGYHCLRLNGLKSENLVQGRTVFERFLTTNGYKMKLQDVGGDAEHPLIWSEVYGMFPPRGVMSNIIQRHWVDRARKEWLFESATTPGAGEDVGFTGDSPALSSGRAGRAVAWRDYQGVRHDLPAPRWVIQLDGVGVLPLTGDSQLLADETMSRLRPLGVKPGLFAIDRTGVGQGTHDIIRHQWREKVDGQKGAAETVDIMGIHYSESPTDARIGEEDTKSPKELYASIIGEMWYATARFFEHDCLGIGKGVDEQTISELVNRRGGSPAGKGKLVTVESKKDFKERNGGKSPDRADAVIQLVHVFRHNIAELKPKAPATNVEAPRRPSLFDTDAKEGLKFGEALDMGWQAIGTDKDVKNLRLNVD